MTSKWATGWGLSTCQRMMKFQHHFINRSVLVVPLLLFGSLVFDHGTQVSQRNPRLGTIKCVKSCNQCRKSIFCGRSNNLTLMLDVVCDLKWRMSSFLFESLHEWKKDPLISDNLPLNAGARVKLPLCLDMSDWWSIRIDMDSRKCTQIKCLFSMHVH